MVEESSKPFEKTFPINEPSTAAEAELELQRKLFVAKLPNDATELELEEFFNQVGKVQKVLIVTKNHEPTGYGFVTFSEISKLDSAIKKLNKLSFKGKKLTVEAAIPKKDLINSRRNRARGKSSKFSSNKGSKSKGTNFNWADEVEEQNITDLVKRGPPPPVKGRRFPYPMITHKVEGEASDRTIFVGNLGLDVTENKFVEVFLDLKIEKAWLVRREYPPFMVKGFGFIELSSHEEQLKALESASTRFYNGRPLQIRTAILPKPNQTSSTTETTMIKLKSKPKPKAKAKKPDQEIPTEASWPPLSASKLPNGVVDKTPSKEKAEGVQVKKETADEPKGEESSKENQKLDQVPT